MLKRFLLAVLLILTCMLLWQRTSVGSGYYYSRAMSQYNAGHYDSSLPLFERALRNNQNPKYRLDYVHALSKSVPTYSVQKNMYVIAHSDIDDGAKAEAKFQLAPMREKLMKGVEDNYIFNAVSGKQIIRWDMRKFPLKYYIEPAVGIPPYYTKNVEKALSDWSARTGFIKFVQAPDKKSANIYISFKDYTSDECKGKDCRYMVAYTDPVITASGVLQRMDLTFHKTNPRKVSFSAREIYNTALHEIGHTLGLMGHSDNSYDIMYSNGDGVNSVYAPYRSDFMNLSMRDLKTLALLYRIAPTISNTRNLHSEKFYYAPLILGNEDELLQRKLVELERYITAYPNFAAGYINVSSVYADLGQVKKALSTLDKAQQLAKTADEFYLVEYNRAVIYYNNHDIKSALVYAQKAKGIKSTPEIAELISEIAKVMH